MRTKKLKEKMILFLTLLVLIFLSTCQKEEFSHKKKEKERFSKEFFNYEGDLVLMKSITSFLKSKNDSLDFITEFVEKFGYPVWDKSVHISDVEQTTFFVPIKNELLNEIETIWLFRIKGGRIRYYKFSKTSSNHDISWTFDYFTQVILKTLPKSGLVFKIAQDNSEVVTRGGWLNVERCNYVYFYGGEYQRYIGKHCWNTVIPGNNHDDEEIDEEFCDDFSSGGGGGGGSAYVDEIIPDKSLSDYPELKNIYDCIIGNSTGLVKEWLSRYIGEAAPFNLTFKVGDLGDKTMGHFTYKNPFNSEIVINKNKFLGKSSLDIVRTFIHETMHAYMHAYLFSEKSEDPNYGKSKSFDKTFNDFQAKIVRDRPDLHVDDEHLLMAEKWINKLAEELHCLHKTQKEYEKLWKELANYPGIDMSTRDLFYEAFAWEGLYNTDAYKKLDPNKLKIYKEKQDLLPKYTSYEGKWKCD